MNSEDEMIPNLKSDTDSEDNSNVIKKEKRKEKKKDKNKVKNKNLKKVKNSLEQYFEEVEEDISEEENNTDNKQNKDISDKYFQKRTLLDLDELEKRYPVKNDKISDDEYYDTNESNSEEYSENDEIRNFELPSINDPKLFEVRCKLGYEKESVICLTNKFFDFKKKNKTLNIFSCYQIDKYEGSIFVEAMKEFHVKEAVKDLYNLNENYIKIIPIKEIQTLITPDPSRNINIKEGQFIRIKRGIYENDLGIIEKLEEGGKSITVKLVPRIHNKESNKSMRPQQKFFNVEDYPDCNILNNMGIEKFYIYKNQKFLNGFILKKFNPGLIDWENVVPKYNEIRDFQEFETKKKALKYIQEATNLIKKSKNELKNLEKGEQIKVIKGDLINLVGTIIDLNDTNLTVKPIKSELTGNINLHYDEIQKFFENSDHVIIVSGKYKNISGSIIKIEENIATIITDENNNELQININDLKKYYNNYEKEIKKNNDRNLARFDLVLINDNKTYGIIISIMQDKVTILDYDNVLKTFQKFEIKGKINKLREINNCFGNKIRQKCIVLILDGKRKFSSAVVKQVYNNYLFLYDQNIKENTGVFVELADNCLLRGSNINDNTFKLSKFNTVGSNNNFEERNNFTVNDLNRADNRLKLINKKFKVKKGEYKDHEGIVKSISDNRIKFELTTMNKIINLTLDYIGIFNENKSNNMNYNNYSKTPLERVNYYDKTPAYNPDFNN